MRGAGGGQTFSAPGLLTIATKSAALSSVSTALGQRPMAPGPPSVSPGAPSPSPTLASEPSQARPSTWTSGATKASMMRAPSGAPFWMPVSRAQRERALGQGGEHVRGADDQETVRRQFSAAIAPRS
jgi:hypothetical protein